MCSHCDSSFTSAEPVSPPDSDLSEPVPEPDEQEPVSEAGEGSLVDTSLVKKEYLQGKAELKKGNNELARLLLKNAAALELLNDNRDSGRSEAILALLKQCDSSGIRVKIKCTACSGSGNRVVAFGSLSGSELQRKVKGSKCQQCSGKGSVYRVGHVDDVKYSIGRARKKFADIQASKKFVSVGGAWLPSGIESRLTVRQRVNLKKMTASPCGDCMGTGREGCRKCDGYGRVKCTNNDCENGLEEVVLKGTISDSEIRRRDKCRTCRGTAHLLCKVCRGSGSLLCKKCNGTGNRDICTKCGGQAVSECRRCRATGEYKAAVCGSCSGERIVECRSCNGDGKKR